MKTLEEKLDELQAKYEDMGFRCNSQRKWAKGNFWLGRAAGIEEAAGEYRFRGYFKRKKIEGASK